MSDASPRRQVTVFLYLTPSGYMALGSRWIIMPIALVMVMAGGVFYGWLRGTTGSVWPAAVRHNAFNTWFQTLTRMAMVSSPVAFPYTVGETGIATMVVSVLAAWVLLRRSAVFHRPAQPATVPAAAADVDPQYSMRQL